MYKISIVHALRALSGCLCMVVLPGHKMAAPSQSNFIFGCRTTEATPRYKRFLSSPNTSGVIGRETRDFFFGCPGFVFCSPHTHCLHYTHPLFPRGCPPSEAPRCYHVGLTAQRYSSLQSTSIGLSNGTRLVEIHPISMEMGSLMFYFLTP